MHFDTDPSDRPAPAAPESGSAKKKANVAPATDPIECLKLHDMAQQQACLATYCKQQPSAGYCKTHFPSANGQKPSNDTVDPFAR